MIDVAPQPILDDLPRMEAALHRHDRRLRAVGRRDLRSNNSWMHNVEVLVKGKPRCVLHVHPDDAASIGLDRRRAGQGDAAGSARSSCRSRSPTGSAPASSACPTAGATTCPAAELDVAARHAGVNSNLLTDDHAVDALTGTAVLNGIPVELVARLIHRSVCCTECHASGLRSRHSDAANDSNRGRLPAGRRRGGKG